MDAYIPSPSPIPDSPDESLPGSIRQVEAGYAFGRFTDLADTLSVSQAYLAEILDISPSTLQRRRGARFTPAESGRLYGLERLLEQAEATIGDAGDARAWLVRTSPSLGAAPLDLAKTAPGLEAVGRYLAQIADGVYL